MMYFDAHSDIWTDVTRRRLQGETDVLRRLHLPRLREGGVEGSILAIWVDPPYNERDDETRTQQILQCARAELAECPEARLVHSWAEAEQARAEGIFYIFLGVEGLAAIGRDTERIRDYYGWGARHAMLTWNEENELAIGAVTGKRGGLTDAGKQAIRTMQSLGMLVDVSHLNEDGFWDIAKLTSRPFVATHSNCRALCDVPRNLTDDQLRAIRDADGVIGLNAYARFISNDPKRRNVEELAHHAAHILDVCGVNSVGCGFDFLDFLPEENDLPTAGFSSARDISSLFACLEKMGLSQADREKIARGNFQRVLQAALA